MAERELPGWTKGLTDLMAVMWPESKRNNPATIREYRERLSACDQRDAGAAVAWLTEHSKNWPSWDEVRWALDEAQTRRKVGEANTSAPATPAVHRISIGHREQYRQLHEALRAGRITPAEHAQACRAIAAEMHLDDSLPGWDRRIAELERAGAPAGNALAGVAW